MNDGNFITISFAVVLVIVISVMAFLEVSKRKKAAREHQSEKIYTI